MLPKRVFHIEMGLLALLLQQSCGSLAKPAKPVGNKASVAADDDAAPSGSEGPTKVADSGTTTVSATTTMTEVAPQGSDVPASIPTPTPQISLKPCAPKGAVPVGYRLVYDQVNGGVLNIDGDANANSITVSGGGGPGVVRIITNVPSDATIVPCVIGIRLSGNAGDDVLKVEGSFPGVTSINVDGGIGVNSISISGSVSGSITVN